MYYITPKGLGVSHKLSSMYAISYRKSVKFIVRELKRYKDSELWENASRWLEAKSSQIDLYDMVEEKKEKNE